MDGTLIAVLLLGLGLGAAAQHWLLRRSNRKRIEAAEREAERLVSGAQESARRYRDEFVQEASAALAEERDALEAERDKSRHQLRRMRQRLQRREHKANSRTQGLNKRDALLQKANAALKLLHRQAKKLNSDAKSLSVRAAKVMASSEAKQTALDEREQAIGKKVEAIEALKVDLDRAIGEQTQRLVEIGGMSAEEAREELKKLMVERAQEEGAVLVHRAIEDAKRMARHSARKVVLTVIQRTAGSLSVENTASIVHLESDKVKGRIIGREGRNIRAFETTTGVEVIVDDTPNTVVLSCFDPLRREIARRAMQTLVKDGRINPSNIERKVRAATESLEEDMVDQGERAVIQLKIRNLHPAIKRLVGHMRFRTSYGQNLYAHSLETARIASLIAVELGMDHHLARRAGLLHDIGKVITDQSERSHALVGMDLCKRYREHPAVCNAVGAHHDEIEMTALISPIIQAADAISAARPGARRSTIEEYIRRLEQLETLASSFEGVERVFAFQAGKEVRVIVDHDKIGDSKAGSLASDISQLIEDEMRYPGQIKVTVIREVRATSYAR